MAAALAYRTHSPGQLAWFAGRQPSGAESCCKGCGTKTAPQRYTGWYRKKWNICTQCKYLLSCDFLCNDNGSMVYLRERINIFCHFAILQISNIVCDIIYDVFNEYACIK